MSSWQPTSQQILAARGPKHAVDPFRPYAMLVEPELSASGVVEDVATVFLTNRECAFQCLMCDLWKNTTEDNVPVGAIATQIRYALQHLAPAQHIKLYNSGNFFDPQSIARQEWPHIAALVRDFQTVIVENHPRLCTDAVAEFQQQCGTGLEVAMGLETSHQDTLRRLNKRMTLDDFARACEFLRQHQIRIRAFVLLRPPGTSEHDGIARAIQSVEFAFDQGVNCCAIIPTRSGNGILDQLEAQGLFQEPELSSLEDVLDVTISWKRGRVFADLWDLRRFSRCSACLSARTERLQQMNHTQMVLPRIRCDVCTEKAPVS